MLGSVRGGEGRDRAEPAREAEHPEVPQELPVDAGHDRGRTQIRSNFVAGRLSAWAMALASSLCANWSITAFT